MSNVLQSEAQESAMERPAKTDTVRIGRVRAGATHLGASLCFELIAVLLVFGLWYPPPLWEIQGVGKLLLVLIGVDVAIGPMMTTIIFNPAKGWRLLRFDLMVIVALQTAAFLYGMSAIFSGRPAYLVFSIDRFDLVQAQDVSRTSLEKANAAGQQGMPVWGPRTVASRKPAALAEQQELLFSSMAGGADLPQLPHLYVSYEEDRPQVLKHLHPLEELRKQNKLDEAAWSRVLTELGRPENELGYVPLMGKAKEGAVIVDAKSAAVVRILTLLPDWNSPHSAKARGAKENAPESVSPTPPEPQANGEQSPERGTQMVR